MLQKQLKRKRKNQRGKRNNMAEYAPFLFDERGNQLALNELTEGTYDITFVYKDRRVTAPLITKQDVEEVITRINAVSPTNVVTVSRRIMDTAEIEGLERRFGISVD